MIRKSPSALGALSLLLLGACATGQPLDSPFGGEGIEETRIRIDVRNLNWNEARLYAVSAGRRIRLGTVGGSQDAVYNLDWDFTLPLQIEIQLVAGPTCTTRQMMVDPGDHLELQIEGDSPTRDFCRRL